MKKFLYNYAHWIMLVLCAALTFAALRLPEEDIAPVRAAAAQNTPKRHFTGEPLALQPYLPDEPVWNASLGLWQTHAGLDLPIEGDVCAPVSGEIASVSDDPVWGACVEIRNENELVRIRSLSAVTVRTGDQVQAGDAIGRAGIAPCEAALGAHIHLEYERGGFPADPSSLF